MTDKINVIQELERGNFCHVNYEATLPFCTMLCNSILKEIYNRDEKLKQAQEMASRNAEDALYQQAEKIKAQEELQKVKADVIGKIRELMKSMPARSDLSVYQHTISLLDEIEKEGQDD